LAIELLGINGMTNTMKQFYDKKLLSVAMLNLVYYQYGEKRPIPARGGKSIEFRRFEKLGTGGALTEGTPPAVTQATISAVSATISQYGQWSQVSDVLQVQGYDPVVAEFVDKYGQGMGETLDTVVRDALSSFTSTQYAGTATVVATSGAGAVGSGQYVNSSELLEMKRTLKRNSAKPIVDNKFICLVHPDNVKDLYEDTDIRQDLRFASPEALKSGAIGDWNGIRFVESENVRIRTSYGMSGADIYEVLMLGKEAYGCSELSAMQARTIIHPLGSGGHTDPLEQYSTVGWKAALAVTILNNNWAVLLYCASSRSNAA